MSTPRPPLTAVLRRYWAHWRSDHRATRRLFPPAALHDIAQAVQAAEAGSSGEVRVCIEAALPWGYLRRHLHTRDRAVTLFGKLRVWDTPHNNGVLLYVNLAERHVELVCDRALAQAVPPATWHAITRRACDALREGRAAAGVVQAVAECGALLREHFAQSTPRHNAMPDSPTVL